MNIESAPPGIPKWNPDDVTASLEAIMLYVEREANKSISWYWTNKRSKAIWSQAIRMSAVTLTALGGLFPIVVRILNPVLERMQSSASKYTVPDSGLASSLFVGFAAGLYGLDKAFGFSSGWTRYVLAATVLEKTLEEFRLQWMFLMAKVGRNPTPDQIEALLKCAQNFRLAVSGAVLQETKDWVTEFQNNLGELERDTRAQLDLLRAAVEKTAQEKVEESRTGAIELTLTDPASFQVVLEGEKGAILKESVSKSKTWAGVGIAPGQYRMQLTGTIQDKDVTVTKVVTVKPNETTAIQYELA